MFRCAAPFRFRTCWMEVWLRQHTFEVEGPYGAVLGTRRQFPVHLAYAMTAHRLQGLALDWLAIYCEELTMPGQVYAALSRVRSLNRVRVEGYIRGRHDQVDQRALAFYFGLELKLRQVAGGGSAPA